MPSQSSASFSHIPQTYLPRRHHYWYARCKLASDPLYDGVGAALRDTQAPLLDLGCGLGLLAHTLGAQGFCGEYRGLDNDAKKIASAQSAATRAGLQRASFSCVDLAHGAFPGHHGSVALLDVLQFLPSAAAMILIERAAACITPGAHLIIRSGLEQTGLRTHFTRAIDTMSRSVGWMNAGPSQYPRRADLSTLLERCGLRASFTPLHGRLPFNNWLIVAEPL